MSNGNGIGKEMRMGLQDDRDPHRTDEAVFGAALSVSKGSERLGFTGRG